MRTVNKYQSGLFGVFALLIQSCTTIPGASPVQQALGVSTIYSGDNFGQRPSIQTPEDIHRLTEKQQTEFLAYLNKPRFANTEKNEALFEYLQDKVEGYQYEGVTLSASDALSLNGGNCMTLAILTSALAQIAGIEIDYELMDDIPLYEINDRTILKGVHIRTILYNKTLNTEENLLLFSRPGIKIDYFPTNRQRFIANLDENDYLTMYYDNVAVEALMANDLNRAYWYSMEALRYSPGSSSTINMLAILNRRQGDTEKAEQLYVYGIEHAEEKLTLLKNYHNLLTNLGRTEDAVSIEKRLQTLDDPSPFHWIQIARSAYESGEYQQAINYFNKAISLAPYLHEAQLGIAQSLYKTGELQGAKKALVAAIEKAQKRSTVSLYEAKLASLRSEI
jgi:tetratricopeptide (TPR) repeat protein